MKRRVVVTGVGVVTAISCQVEDLWNRILAGESGVHPVRLFDISDFKVKIGGDIYDWDPREHISPQGNQAYRSLYAICDGSRRRCHQGFWDRL